MQIISTIYFQFRQFYCFAHSGSACFILDLICYFDNLGLILEKQDLRKLTRHSTINSIKSWTQFIAINDCVMWKQFAR